MNRAGPAAVRAAVLERLAGNRTPTGGYRLHNLFRVALVAPPDQARDAIARGRGGLAAEGRQPPGQSGEAAGPAPVRLTCRARCAPTVGLDPVAGVRAGHGAAGDGDDLDGGERKEWSHTSMLGAQRH
jgi:hypothetical protein